MSEAECQLLFDGFVSENEETLKRFKAACLVDLELSVEDVMAIINNERSVIRVGSRVELEPLRELLTRLGANVSLLGGKSPEISEPAAQAEGEPDTMVFEFDELDISGPPTPPKAKEPKAYVLNLDEELKEEIAPEKKSVTPSQNADLDLGLSFNDSPADSGLDLLASALETSNPKLEVTPSAVSDKIPKPIAPKAPMESLELTLGPEPVEVKAKELVPEVREEDFQIKAVDPEVSEGKNGLAFSVEEVKATPPPQPKHSAPPPKHEPEINAKAQEPKFDTHEDVKPQIAKAPEHPSKIDPKEAKEELVSKKVEETVKETEEVEFETPTKKKKKLRNISLDSEFSFTRNQMILLFIVGLVFLGGTNFLLNYDSESDVPELVIPQLPPEPSLEQKAAEKKSNAPKQAQWSGANKNSNYAVFVSLNEGPKSAMLLRISGTTSEPAPLTPEEIVKKVKPRPWLRRVDGEPIVLISESPTKLSGSGSIFGFVEHGDARKRIPLNVLVQIEMKEDRTSAAAQVVISYLPNNETALPAKGNVIESAPNDSYRIALEADMELSQK